MKKICTLFTLFILTSATFAQAPTWRWIKSTTGNTSQRSVAAVTDATGNIYTTGFFNSGTIVFGDTALTGGGGQDLYLTKYDATGNVLWARRAGGTDDDIPSAIATDNAGNVYIVGYYASPAITFGSFTLTNSIYYHLFIAKYDAAGNVLWAMRAGGDGYDLANSVAVDPSGNVYVGGRYSSSTLAFGSITLTNTNTNDDAFLVKLDPNGNALWAKSAGNINSDGVNAVTADAAGNVYAAGYYASYKIIFDTDTLTNYSFYNNAFLVKYDANGNLLWAETPTSIGGVTISAITTDASENLYTTGFFSDGPTAVLDTITITNSGNSDFFVAKYHPDGAILWAKRAGGADYDYTTSIAADVAGGGVYISGYFGNDTLPFNAGNISNDGSFDAFIAKYTSNGNAQWAKSLHGVENDYGASVAADASGNAYLLGYFLTPAFNLDGIPLVNADTTGYHYQIFLANLADITGIRENGQDNEAVLIYPNPGTGKMEVNTGGALIKSIDVYTLLGEKIYSEKTAAASIFVDLPLPAGIYFLRLTTAKGDITKKIIISK